MADKYEHLQRSERDAALAEHFHAFEDSPAGINCWAVVFAYYSVFHRLHALALAKLSRAPDNDHGAVWEVFTAVDPQRRDNKARVMELYNIARDSRYTVGHRWYGPSYPNVESAIDRAVSLMRQLNRDIDEYL